MFANFVHDYPKLFFNLKR